MRDKFGLFENEVEPSTGISDHAEDCKLIDRSEEEDTEGEAMG